MWFISLGRREDREKNATAFHKSGFHGMTNLACQLLEILQDLALQEKEKLYLEMRHPYICWGLVNTQISKYKAA